MLDSIFYLIQIIMLKLSKIRILIQMTNDNDVSQDLSCLGKWQINPYGLFNTKSYIYIYIYMICKQIVSNFIFTLELICLHTNGFKYCYPTLIIQFNINHLPVQLNVFYNCYVTLTIISNINCLHTFKWFQVLLSNTNKSF